MYFHLGLELTHTCNSPSPLHGIKEMVNKKQAQYHIDIWKQQKNGEGFSTKKTEAICNWSVNIQVFLLNNFHCIFIHCLNFFVYAKNVAYKLNKKCNPNKANNIEKRQTWTKECVSCFIPCEGCCTITWILPMCWVCSTAISHHSDQSSSYNCCTIFVPLPRSKVSCALSFMVHITINL